jgi:hypothetical protein
MPFDTRSVGFCRSTCWTSIIEHDGKDPSLPRAWVYSSFQGTISCDSAPGLKWVLWRQTYLKCESRFKLCFQDCQIDNFEIQRGNTNTGWSARKPTTTTNIGPTGFNNRGCPYILYSEPTFLMLQNWPLVKETRDTKRVFSFVCAL